MKSFRMTILAMAAAIALAGAARADQVSHEAAIKELFNVTHMATNITNSMEQLVRLQMRQNPQLAPFEDILREFFGKYMSWEALQNDILALYVESFTEEEIRELIAFYTTPTGQKTMKTLPVVMAKGAEIGQRRVQANIGELQAKLQAEAQRLKALKAQESGPGAVETTPGGLAQVPPPPAP